MKNISIAIVDENKLFTIRLKLFLIQEEFKTVKTYHSINELLEEKINFDLIIMDEEKFEDIFLKTFPNTIFLLISNEIKDSENFRIFYIIKNFSNNMLKQEIEIISLIKNYEKEVNKKNEELKKALEYISEQADIAATKQLNMIFDNVSFKRIGNYCFDNYYSPKDKLSGDSYIAWQTNGYIFISIIDAMGKGIGASLTATLTSGIGNYILDKESTLENILANLINYIKNILLDNEALCMLLLKINLKTNEFKIANFGMPPIYIKKGKEIEKIRSNNRPILKNSKEKIIIDTYKKEFDMMLLMSDGLIESTNEEGIPYYVNFKKILPESDFLREIINDFKKNAIQDDDTTVYAILKQKYNYETLYENSFTFSSKKDLDNIINTIEKYIHTDEITKQKIYLTLQEILLNIYEHAYRTNYDKQKILEKNQDFTQINGKIYIKISQNSKYFNIIIKDDGRGFDVSKILRLENKHNFKRFHRRGLLLILNMVSGLFFEDNGRRVNIYIRKNNGN